MTTYIYTHITSPLYSLKILIFRFLLVVIKNKEVFLIFLFVFTLLFLYLEYLYIFLLNQVIISEDCFTLNITGGESSSQGSNPQNINSGGSFSNNPNPGSDPGPGPGFGLHPSYLDTVMIRDTDRLANHLEHFRGKVLSNAGINFVRYPDFH